MSLILINSIFSYNCKYSFVYVIIAECLIIYNFKFLSRVSHAAKAFEGCDRSYKAVFAEPKKQKNPFEVYERFSGPSPMMPYDNSYTPFNASM